MSKTILSLSSRFLALAASLVLGACGWAEWPPPQTVGTVSPRTSAYVSPAPRPAARQPGGRSDDIFIGAETVTVGRGDTVYAIARRHGVSPRAIVEANNLRPPYRLEVGQRLSLPRGADHTVKRGDTLSGLSRQYDVDMYVLARANGLKPPYTILVGQTLKIPVGRAAPTVPAESRVVSAPVPVAAQPTSPRTRSDGTAVTMVQPKPQLVPSKPRKVAKPPPKSGSGFAWPAKGKVISGYGGVSKGLQNDGINIAAPRGTPVKSSEHGVVAYAGNEIRGFGNLLLIKHSGGWITAYAHNDRILVKRGDKIRKGQVISRIGSTGNVATPQLHFEIRRGRQAVDPMKHLSGGKVS
jgi:murein DD-endopeptidase MepM/ murein hydrolase activator NlpD